MKIDESIQSILKDLEEAKEIDFEKYKDSQDLEVLRKIHKQMIGIEKYYLHNISNKNKETHDILYFINKTINKIKVYIEKIEERDKE